MKPASILRFLFGMLIVLVLPVRPSPAQAQNDPPVYLIIAPDEFQDVLIPFIDLKTSQGFQTELALLSQTGVTNYSIKTFIRSFTPWPRYVLLAGDTDLIPAWAVTIDPAEPISCWVTSTTLTDLYYAVDDNDCVPNPDLILGRLPVHSADQLTTLIDKYLAYAAAPPDSFWRDKLSFVASNGPAYYLDYDGSHSYVIDHYTNLRGFRGTFSRTGAPTSGGDRLYPVAYNANRQDLLAALNEGRLAVTYYGPGSATSWDWITIDHFTPGDVTALTGPPVPLVFAMAPGTADYRVENSMADAWLNHPTGGALAYIGSSFDPQYNRANEYLERFFWQDILAEPTATTSIGEALHATLREFPTLYPGSATAKTYWEAYQILGDPSLLIIPCQCGRLSSPHDLYQGKLGQLILFPVTLTNLDILTRDFSLSLSAPAAFEVNLSADLVQGLAPGKSKDLYVSVVIPRDIPSSSGDIRIVADPIEEMSTLSVHVEADLEKVYLPIVHHYP